MRQDIQKTVNTIANFVPGMISGATLEFFNKTRITNSQFVTLMAVFYSGRCTMGYLARRLNVTMPTVTGLIDRLAKLHYVRRSTSPEDRRKVYIELTGRGMQLIKDFKALVRQRWSSILLGLKEQEVRGLGATFEKLSRIVEDQKHESTV
jgi:DNA-binding MarR family transcriptional regulator